MNKENRLTLNKVVRALVHGFEIPVDKIILTGSMALDMYGILPEHRKCHDVDILVDVDDNLWNKIKFLDAVWGYHTNTNYTNTSSIMFKENDYIINLWRCTSKDIIKCDVKDVITGIRIKNIKSIIDVKKTYGRSKDFKDIMDICKELI